MGGYFIINGNERAIRLLIAPRRDHLMGIIRPSFKNRGPEFGPHAVLVRCARPDGTSPTSVTASTRARESPVTHTPPSAPALAWLASVQSLLGCGACVR